VSNAESDTDVQLTVIKVSCRELACF
jgi:hypothetical protein